MGTKVLTRLLLLALILGVSLAGAAQEDEEIPATRTAVLHFRGNAAFDEEQLLQASGLPLTKSHLFKRKTQVSAEESEGIVNELTIFYRREGYFDISISREETEKTFEIAISEGPLYKISELEVSLDKEDDKSPALLASAKEKVLMKNGGPFRVAEYEAAKQSIEKEFGETGYPFIKASPSAEVDVAAKTVKVRIDVSPGERAVFGPVTFEGVINSEEPVLRKIIMFREGDPYDVSRLDATKDAFYKTGLFDVVTVRVRKPTPTGEAPVDLILKEGRHRKVKLAVGYGSDEKFRFQAGWETLRLHGRYVNAGFNLKKSHLETTGEAHLRRPYFIEKYTFFAVAKLTRLNWIQTDFTALTLSSGLERKFGGGTIVTAEAAIEKIERIDFTFPSPRVAPGALKPWVFSVRLNAVRNTTDDPLDPSSGYIVQGSLEPGAVKDAGVKYLRLSAECRRFWEVKEDRVLAFRVKAASLVTSSPVGRIPYPGRFFTGGQMKLRGYSFSSVSPRDRNGSLSGGLGLIESSLEYRFPVKGDFKGIVFFDAGKATRDKFPLNNLSNFNCGTGFGVRYMTAVGPVGMDVAFRLNEAPYSSAHYQVALFIGYAF